MGCCRGQGTSSRLVNVDLALFHILVVPVRGKAVEVIIYRAPTVYFAWEHSTLYILKFVHEPKHEVSLSQFMVRTLRFKEFK